MNRHFATRLDAQKIDNDCPFKPRIHQVLLDLLHDEPSGELWLECDLFEQLRSTIFSLSYDGGETLALEPQRKRNQNVWESLCARVEVKLTVRKGEIHHSPSARVING
jgi:hypothetical protein